MLPIEANVKISEHCLVVGEDDRPLKKLTP